MLELKNKIAIVVLDNTKLLLANELAGRLNLDVIQGVAENCQEGHVILSEAKKVPVQRDPSVQKTHLRMTGKQKTCLRMTISKYPFLLVVTSDHLEIREVNNKNSQPIFVDFLSPTLSYRTKFGGGNKQLIARAVGLKGGFRPTVLDATAGLGIDAFVLASLGCEVIMIERSLIIGTLLKNGLERLQKDPKSKEIKLSLHISQAMDYFRDIFSSKIEKPDIIYLDPMYPERQKTALGKKSMRILQEIVGRDEDAAEMLNFALKCAKKRVIVKRLNNAPNLGLLKPNLVFSSNKSCRYDVYFPQNI